MNFTFHGGLFVRAIFLTGCASLWVAWGSDALMPSTVVGTTALGLAAAVAIAMVTKAQGLLAVNQLPPTRGNRRRPRADGWAMQAIPVTDALRTPGFAHTDGRRAGTTRVGGSPDAAGNPAPAYVINVSRAVVPARWTSMLMAPVELLAVAWSVPVLMLLVAVPIALTVALLLRIARLVF